MSVIPEKKKARVIERDAGLCVLRLKDCLTEATVADHRANRGHGGAGKRLDGYSNLIAACRLCNGAKENVDGELRALLIARGVRVQSASTHAKTALRALEKPVYYPDGTVFLLDDDGGRQEWKEAAA